MNAAAQRLEECVEQLKRGELTEQQLRDLGKVLGGNGSRRQSLLYLQTATTAVTSDVIGMLQVADGEVSDGPFDPRAIASNFERQISRNFAI